MRWPGEGPPPHYRVAITHKYAPAVKRAVLEPSADPLCQLDDDPLRAADVAKPIDVFVVLHLANELPAAGAHASDDGVDVVDCECAMAEPQCVRRHGHAFLFVIRPWSGLRRLRRP
jgi:hypothetical protein